MQGIMNVIEMVNSYEELLYIVMFFCFGLVGWLFFGGRLGMGRTLLSLY